MKFVNKTWDKIRVHKETKEMPTPLMSVRHGDVVEVFKDSLIQEYREAGLTPIEVKAENKSKIKKSTRSKYG